MGTTQPQRQPNLARLRKGLRLHGVTQKRIAEEAQVTKFTVCHVLAGRAKSRRIIEIALRLLAEARVGPEHAVAESQAS